MQRTGGGGGLEALALEVPHLAGGAHSLGQVDRQHDHSSTLTANILGFRILSSYINIFDKNIFIYTYISILCNYEQ